MARKKRSSGGKRSSGEGSLYERANGKWEAKITVGKDPLTGKPIRKSFYADSEKEVKKKRDKYLSEVRTNTYIEPDKLLFGEWITRWLDLFVKPKVRMSTYSKYSINAKTHIISMLGNIELQKLNTEHIQYFYNAKAQTLSTSVLAVLHQVISGALKQAVRQKLILFNPADHTSRPSVKYREIAPMTTEEMQKFYEVAKDDRLYMAFLVDMTTGLRRGELLALRWSEVDLSAGIITIKESLSRVQDYDGKTSLQFTEPKTANSKRDVPLMPDVVQSLKFHKARQAQEKLQLGCAYQDNGLVFATAEGKPIEPRNLLRKFKDLLKKAEIRTELRLHDLRHTFGNMLAQAGENPETLQKLLGHADVRTSLNRYCHSQLEDKKRAVNKVANNFKFIDSK